MHNDQENVSEQESGISRRSFVKGAATAAAFSIVPRHVLGGTGFVAPSDRLRLACIGVGAQGTRVMMDFMKEQDVQVVAVCDVNRQSSDYSEWGPNELRDKVRKLLDKPDWGSGFSGTGATCGRDPAKNIVETYYGNKQPSGSYKGCATYSDFRDLLAKEKDIDAVTVCTPDHWHAPIAIAAMKQKKNVYCQKPMTHSVAEARQMAQVARETKVATQVAVGRRSRTPFPTDSIGICGLVRRRNGRSTTSICRSCGVVGTISAAARSATWASTALIRSSAH
jgi:hypothetical protein